MPSQITVLQDAVGAWPETKTWDKNFLHHHTGPIDIARMANGVKGGGASACIKVELESGDLVIIETPLDLLLKALDAIRAYDEHDRQEIEASNIIIPGGFKTGEIVTGSN